jgi:hypothetical protein
LLLVDERRRKYMWEKGVKDSVVQFLETRRGGVEKKKKSVGTDDGNLSLEEIIKKKGENICVSVWERWRQLLFSIHSKSNYDWKSMESKVTEKEEQQQEHK